jgi:hypothetical protein
LAASVVPAQSNRQTPLEAYDLKLIRRRLPWPASVILIPPTDRASMTSGLVKT